MKIYHGTSADVARRALTEGLLPRNDLGTEGNWTGTVKSRGDMVYLTAAYAPFFAAAAVEPREPWGVVEVELDDSDVPNLRPDEDFLEQATRGVGPDHGLYIPGSMEERTIVFRGALDALAECWEDSLKGISNIAHRGRIAPGKITRIALYDPSSNGLITMKALDPAITVLNYAIMGAGYRALCKWFFEPITPEEYDPLGLHAHLSPHREQFAEALNDRDGLTIISQS